MRNLKALLAGVATVAVLGTAIAQGNPPNAAKKDAATGAGQQSTQGTPMGTTGTPGGTGSTSGSTASGSGSTGSSSGSNMGTASSGTSSGSSMGSSSTSADTASRPTKQRMHRAARADRN